ncbi:RHS repeat-associated core domain-containing protein [Proteus alimentorum]|uniref:RHS repeat-associated core domain-containing protein n=1 Tax=Proteus alimentorum TaxID=1973495 RepID=UPI000BFFDD88|nr:RHS repeat-associated core domain-containing protein [Proteus alimentorum]
MLNQQLHTRTPTVVVYDNRGAAIREINYCRHPDTINKTDERITRHYFHARGYLERSIDARLYEAQQSDATIQPNIQQVVSLSGALSLSQGVDNGNSFNINDIEGTVAQQINAKGTVTTYEYSAQSVERYLEQVKEGKLGDLDTRVIQKLKWGRGNGDELIGINQVGRCIEYYDTAGKKTADSFSLLGAVLSETQQLHYGDFIDWSSEYEINELKQAEKFTTQYTYDATGAVLAETDAKGHQRRLAYDIAGFVKQSWLTLKGQSEQAILRSLTYSAAGQKLREAHGNGLVTTYKYEPETQRLLHVKTQRPQGHALGAKIMQDLRYEYDPVGNIICLKNDAEATRYWRNQKVVPENRYIYDSLYQLISATGRESANQKTPASIQSQTITTLVKDAQSYTNYTRLYAYDRGGNLTQIRHNSPIAQQSFTQDICVSNKTNRALLESQCSDPKQVDSYFDESGNLTQLLNGDAIIWDSRNHLNATKEIMETGHLSEGETYQYNSASQRVMKIRGRKAAGGDLETVTTHYLPNIEVWEVNENPVTEKYAVVQINAGTSAKVRALCWEMGTPKGIENNSLRYSYDDGVGNSGLETDGQGQLVSYEEYYPYGGAAIWSSENALEADYKTIRYSGKEKDATGLYYYGYRYYQPWIGRWLSADPAGTVDGLNLYRMVRNNPVTLQDPDGRAPAISSIPNDTPLTEIFQWGDILYGLDKPLESFVSVLNSYGFKRKEAIKPPTNNIFKLKRRFFPKKKTNIFIQSDITNAVWNIKKPTKYADDERVNKRLSDPERAIQFRQFISSHERYNVIDQDAATKLKSKLWKRKQLKIPLWNKTSKAGLEFQLLVRKKPLHFIADLIGDDIGVVVSKKGYGTSITSSELRWLYRHRDLPEVRSNLIFYRGGKKISHEEIFGKSEWSNYHPKNQYNKMENKL